METQESENEKFDQQQSLQVIRDMIEVSRKKLQNDGILFIIWGWSLFYSAISRYLISAILFTHSEVRAIKMAGWFISALTLGYTVYYLFLKREKVRTYISNSLRVIWVGAVVCMVLINLIQGNILHSINFEFQHPVFMVVMAFAITVTGVMLRYGLMIVMGILFGLLAYVSSFFDLHYQLLTEAIAWFLAFCLPGHILYARKNR